MNVYICLILCCVPFILCFLFFKFFSSIKISTELFAALSGLLAVVPITFIQFLISDIVFKKSFLSSDGLFSMFMRAVLFNGFIEEVLKTMFMLIIPKKNISFNNFFMAALLCGLCTGCFESIVYFLHYLQNANARGGELVYHLIFSRIFTADLIHMFCAGLCGIFIWSCISRQIDIFTVVFAVVIHGLYDFFASFQSYMKWFSVIAVLFVILETRIHYEKNKPLETYKKSPLPAKSSKDATIETALKDAPVYNPSKKDGQKK